VNDLISDSKIRLNFVDGETIHHTNSIIAKNDFINKAMYAFLPKAVINFDKLKEFALNENDPTWKSFINLVLQNDPSLIAISAYSNQLTTLKIFVKIVKKQLSNCKILLGGIHVTADYRNLVNLIPGIDYYCIGEGEQTFREVVQSLIDEKDIEEIPGIYSPQDPGKFRPRELIQDLDQISQPNRLLAPKNLYRDEFHIFSSRGCPFRCNFCSSHMIWSRKTRYHSAERILSEINLIVEKLNGYRIIFVDDTFTLDKKRIFQIMNAIVERGYSNLNIHIGARIDTVDEKMLDILVRSGIKSMSFGIETGSPKIQKLCGKNINIQKIIDILHYAHSIGIHTLTYYIVGHPQETEEDVEATIRLIKAAGASRASVCAMQPLPGTEIYELASKTGFKIGLENSIEIDQQKVPIVNLTKMKDETLKQKVFKAYKVANRLSHIGMLIQTYYYYIDKIKKSLIV
jgi:radical SAM superfamily enzyme YgiQ (UPF0313 family)